MRRFALAIVVALLAFSASGVSALVVAEPCSGYAPPGSDDGACPPTCVTCGCCAQAVELLVLTVASSPATPSGAINVFVPQAPQSRAREILHVPKLRFA